MTNTLFITPKPLPHAKIRLFCFPYAGGSTRIFLDWPNLIAPDIELVFVQLPGRGVRLIDPPHHSMEGILSELMEHTDFITSKPFAFFGHSLGSRISYELAYQLHQRALPAPLKLFASASRAPHLSLAKKMIYNLPDDEFINELRQLNGTPQEVLENKELMEFILPLLRADFKVADTYIAKPLALPVPIHVFQGIDDKITDEQTTAWQAVSQHPLDLSKFNGGHFFIHQYSPEMVNKINQDLSMFY